MFSGGGGAEFEVTPLIVAMLCRRHGITTKAGQILPDGGVRTADPAVRTERASVDADAAADAESVVHGDDA